MAQWTFGAVGDVFVNRDNPKDAFVGSSDLLHQIDLVFGNCEGAYTDNPHFAPSAGWRVVAPRSNGIDLAKAGFDVMAVANNHIVDGGHAGLIDTLSLLKSQGIKMVGAGANLSEAIAPAIVEQNSLKIGFLGFASHYPRGYEARRTVPGLAAIRVHSVYCNSPTTFNEPGAVPAVCTFPYPEDVELLKFLIGDLRNKVDLVVVSHHWGLCKPVELTDYERILGRVSVEAGADVVLGHHHHFLRGVEIYRGKPIFYGLGHFVFDLPGLEIIHDEKELEHLKRRGEYGIYPREGYPLSPFHADARMTMAALCDFEGKSMTSVGFVPCQISQENQAMPLKKGDANAQVIVDYMSKISTEIGLQTQYDPISEKFGLAYSRVQIPAPHEKG
ncbi:capsule biosynthesis protein CapA [Bradyrhizobium ottawaense]|uniref:CapA family protein n=1 Tax=Bradyrhizobium ottawaense TaxID=931866 RepID=UPI000BEADF8B|nr:CapA family protein [Bradyrhizobium ottawaense]PDT64090.1 capsule biosynthesis protein CapA [Bradyrhizobium ottawaense]